MIAQRDLCNIYTKIKSYVSVLLKCFICYLCLFENTLSQSTDSVPNLTDAERQWLRDHPVLSASNEREWGPLDFRQNGKAVGFSVDYLNLIANKLGITINYLTEGSWPEQLDLLKDQKIDIAQSIIQTPEREEFLNFTKPYLDLPMVYFGRTGSERINAIDDLQDKKIGIVRGTVAFEVYKEKYPQLNLIEYESTMQALKGLSAGSIDVFTDILSVAVFMINKSLLPGIEVIGDRFFPETENADNIRFATRKDWPFLVAILEKGMAAVTEEEFRNLTEKWQAQNSRVINSSLSQNELKWLSDNKIVKVAIIPDSAPLHFINDDGEISGIAGMFLKEIAQILNIEFSFIEQESWTGAIENIKAGEVDIIPSVVPSDERRKDFILSEPFLSTSNVIFSLEGGTVYGNLDALIGRQVAQVEGYALNDYLKSNYPGIKAVPVSKISDALELVADGEVDAYIGSIPITGQNIAEKGFKRVVAAGETDYKSEYAIGVRKDLPYLANAIQKAYNSIPPTRKSEILREWYTVNVEAKANYELVWKTVGFAILIVMLILIWNKSLRSEIKRRKDVERELLFSEQKARMAQEKAEIAKLEAENANTAKTKFLANMSHEIRTPLNAIIGFSDVMISGIYGEIKEQRYIGYLNDIKNSGNHLATVINDILDLSKIEAGKWKLKETEFSLFQCLHEAMQMLVPHANQKQIMLTYEGDIDNQENSLKLYGDFHALKRAIINLISNAVKYTSNGGSVKCRMYIKRNIVIEISDNGTGIPEDRLEHVLIPFEQLEDSHVLNEEGTGLGLPIVTKLVELHGGKFKLSSQLGIGTCASIILPSERIVVETKSNIA